MFVPSAICLFPLCGIDIKMWFHFFPSLDGWHSTCLFGLSAESYIELCATYLWLLSKLPALIGIVSAEIKLAVFVVVNCSGLNFFFPVCHVFKTATFLFVSLVTWLSNCNYKHKPNVAKSYAGVKNSYISQQFVVTATLMNSYYVLLRWHAFFVAFWHFLHLSVAVASPCITSVH